MKYNIKATTLAITTAILLSACGGDGSDTPKKHDHTNNDQSSGNTQTTIERGRFIDAAVGNIDVYQNGEKIATTDSEGYFDYKDNSEVSFKIGKLTLGSTSVKAIITPADLSTDSNNVVEILQVLQSLDEDGKPDNGIYIPQTTLEKLVTEVDLSDKDTSIIETVKKDIPSLDIVSAKQAVEHFAKSKTDLNASPELIKTANQFVGYWYNDECKNGTQSIDELQRNANDPISVQITQRLTREYSNQDCTGAVVNTFTTPMKDNSLQLTMVGTESNTTHALVSNDYNNQTNTIIAPYMASFNTIDSKTIIALDKNKQFTLTKLKNFEFPEKPTADNKITETVNNMVGYWKSECMQRQSHQGSKTYYLHLTKLASNKLNIEKNLKQHFNNNNCSGKPASTYNNPDSDSNVITISKEKAPTFINHNKFTIDDETYTETYVRIPASHFPQAEEHPETKYSSIVSGNISFLDSEGNNTTVPSDTWIRITPQTLAIDGKWQALYCPVDQVGHFGSNCHGNEEAAQEITTKKGSIKYQVIVFQEQFGKPNRPVNWDRNEKSYRLDGPFDINYQEWNNLTAFID